MIKKVSYFVTVMVMAAVLSSSHNAYGSEYDQGKALYEEKCVICHGANGKGDGPAAAALSPPPKDFSRPEFWNRENVVQIITNQVKNGTGSMPAFSLSDNEIKAIIDYMSHAFEKSN
jgi:mono/diheme cytochrome c family protein